MERFYTETGLVDPAVPLEEVPRPVPEDLPEEPEQGVGLVLPLGNGELHPTAASMT